MYEIKENIRNNINQITFYNIRSIYYTSVIDHIIYLPDHLIVSTLYQNAIRLAFSMKGTTIFYGRTDEDYPDRVSIRGLTFWQFKKNLLLWTIKDDLDI